MTHIIILNWNGATDTIACLESLYKVEGEFCTIVVDNGSKDDSVSRIIDYLAIVDIDYKHIGIDKTIPRQLHNHQCVVVETGENLGFAKGNNYVLKQLTLKADDYVLLLNNDTVVEPDFLSSLVHFSERNPQYSALTPLICFYNPQNIVWNCGGQQKWGIRKYYYANQDVSKIKEKNHLDITFVTGCALFFKPELLDNNKGVFTERFFFGEEDFEFCLRMNKAGKKMACVLGSKIYHKVNASIIQHSPIGKLYIYYLNRFIDIRITKSLLFYIVWSTFYMPYIIKVLHVKQSLPLPIAMKLISKVWLLGFYKKDVTYSDFVKAMQIQAI